MSKLKDDYITRFGKMKLKRNDEQLNMIEREEAFVELVITDMYGLNETCLDKRFVLLEDILKVEDDLVLLGGGVGIGKSTLVETYALRWARDKILTGKNGFPRIDFLFHTTCSSLNSLKEGESFESILGKEFPALFDSIKLSDLSDLAEKVLIIVDGIEQLQYPIGLKAASQCLSNIDKNILKTNTNESLPLLLRGHKLLLSGRSEACLDILNSVDRACKMIEVLGFNQAGITNYISKYYHGKEERESYLTNRIKVSSNLQDMMVIPLYAQIVCGIFDSENRNPENTASLFISIILAALTEKCLFIKKQSPLKDLFFDRRLLLLFIGLAEFSLKMLMEGKTIFNENDIAGLQNKEVMQVCGIIVKTSPEENQYKFRCQFHQQYFAGFYLFLLGDGKLSSTFTGFSTSLNGALIKNRNVLNCLPVVVGLESIIKHKQSSEIVTKFVQNILKIYEQINPKRKKSNIMPFIKKSVFSELQWRYLTYCVIDDKWSLFLAIIHEHQNGIPEYCVKWISQFERLEIEVNYHFQLRNILYFLKNLTFRIKISSFIIHIMDSEMTEHEMIQLAPYLTSSLNVVINAAGVDLKGWYFLTETFEKSIMDGRNLIQHFDLLLTNMLNAHLTFLADCLPHIPVVRLNITKNICPDTMQMISDSTVNVTEPDTCIKKLISLKLSGDISEANFKALFPFVKSATKLCFLNINLSASSWELLEQAYNEDKEQNNNEEIQQKNNEEGERNDNEKSEQNHTEERQKKVIEEIQENDVKENQKIEVREMFLYNCPFPDENAGSIKECLEHLKRFHIYYSDCEVTIPCLEIISNTLTAAYVKKSFRTDLVFYNNKLTDDHIQVLTPLINQCRSLSIRKNSFLTPQSLKMISNAVTEASAKDNTYRLRLNLSECDLHDVHITMLINCLSYLKMLDISGNNKLTLASFRLIAKHLRQSETNTEENMLWLYLGKRKDIDHSNFCVVFNGVYVTGVFQMYEPPPGVYHKIITSSE